MINDGKLSSSKIHQDMHSQNFKIWQRIVNQHASSCYHMQKDSKKNCFLLSLVFVRIVVIIWHASIVQSKMDTERLSHFKCIVGENNLKIGRFEKKQKHVYLLLVSWGHHRLSTYIHPPTHPSSLPGTLTKPGPICLKINKFQYLPPKNTILEH